MHRSISKVETRALWWLLCAVADDCNASWGFSLTFSGLFLGHSCIDILFFFFAQGLSLCERKLKIPHGIWRSFKRSMVYCEVT